MEIKIVERGPVRIIGMKIDTLLKDTREQHLIPKLQQAFHKKVSTIEGVIGLPTTYGIFIDPPNYNPDTDLFTWIAGVEATAEVEVPFDMISYVIPQGSYAVLSYEGDIDNAGSAYDKLFEWIQDSAYEQAGTFGFELYSEKHDVLERKSASFLLHFPVKLSE
ncbi:GyrI-like domain-containing protein [Metabacillus malikii]|uniref:Transcriptional regulator YdeE n=1 Tax=Metabacillus malikii TaxID=1504265 RepID=A0ABT9ZJA2_9BACI|nr:GyrI-like domain-containing protein [Metabacillus malikii]MDQ0232065.1 putative transcriptional regulator YdeE [Metabacillus malikii]